MTGEPIQVWAWDDAPPELKALSPHAGDEDWLAVLPPQWAGREIIWLEEGGAFGRCDVSRHAHPSLPGFEVRIGAHA